MSVTTIHSKNNAMPVWVTIEEAVNIINSQRNVNITESILWRYAFYRYFPLSIYFQSPVILRRVITVKNKLLLIKNTGDLVSRLCYLSSEGFLKNNDWMVKTEGEFMSLPCCVMDTPLLGYECAELQICLARSLRLPLPEKGLHNAYCGLLVCDNDYTYQVFEHITLEKRVIRQLHRIPEDMVDCYRDKISHQAFNRRYRNYFPVYHFPGDACFVVKLSHIEQFIRTFFPVSSTITPTISTPVSRFLWLACKHNDAIKDMTDNPYKLVSVFEQWAAAEGITDHLSGDTLKKALKRGAPV